MKRQRAEKRGRRGETIAAWYLRLKGYRILNRRVRTPRGEIDLIARRGRIIAFIEVKMRNTPQELAFAIDERRLARVAAATESVAHSYATRGENVRIDVILIARRRWPQHIENAWMEMR